jgi:drug/metabolite transporter (DMT)-like permease
VAEEVAVPVSHASSLKLTAMVSLSIAVISLGLWILARFTRGGETLGIGLSLAVMALIGVLYLMARQSGRPDPSGSAIAGALASLVGGPAVGAMFALQPRHSRSTTPRIIAYVLYIAMASVVVSEVGGYALVTALILSPFTVLLGDRWAARPRRVGLSGEFPK